MRFGRLDEFYRDESGLFLGPDVEVVLTLRDGDTVSEIMPVMVAEAMVLFDYENNGSLYKSAKIIYGNLQSEWCRSL